ncbi:FAD-dependent oxidoreductase [Bradyrhizobium barranii subsp. apii]|uniref:FAD-dependent oxidoreductase n=1 Tax=Bradyrhizobium barranii subsp. apii TaxID=2819348 RepID=A0A8T5VPI8_9BRAD|nr:NAD(P)/FAD-dependent oxidoreductase [Bradyrhizobium barranii]UPT89194.1 FAD-dependent oxidoreductase [Bradyrhizobium barranii subsp. apii]
MKKRAIVIGAGPAGTSAAFRLKQAGCDVRLIERDAQVGGRTRSLHQNGFIMDIGAGLMPGTSKAVFSMMDDADLGDMLEPMHAPTAIWRDGTLHYLEATNMASSIMKTKLFSLASKFRMLAAAWPMMRMWNYLNFENLGRSAPFDTENESLAGYTRRVLNQELLDYLINPMQKVLYVTSAERASIVDLFWSAKSKFAGGAFCVRGGMGRIVDLVCVQLNVSLNTEVLSVDETGDKVEVKMRDANGAESTDTVDICVIATPANVVPKIDRGLSPASQNYLSTLHYSMLSDVHVQLKERTSERAVLIMVPDSADKDLCGILVDHNKGSDRAPAGKGSLSIYLHDEWVRKNWALSDEEVFRIAMAKGERVMPGITKLVEGYHVQRCEFGATISHPGGYKKMAKFIDGLDMKRRVQLAGDYFSLSSVNAAVTSGELVAKRLIQNYVH